MSSKLRKSLDFDAFCEYAAYGQLAHVQQMLAGERVKGRKVHVALVRAAANGHVEIVDCLLRHAMFDPSGYNNRAIRMAATYGHRAVVDRLLQDARVDPSANNNEVVRSAACYGHLAVVERLLQDERVDPSAGGRT